MRATHSTPERRPKSALAAREVSREMNLQSLQPEDQRQTKIALTGDEERPVDGRIVSHARQILESASGRSDAGPGSA
jgi:hypothetical protein